MIKHDIEYAGFWVRVGASLIDTIFLCAIIYPPLIYIYGWQYFEPGSNWIIAGPADFLISWVFPMVLVIAFWIWKEATPGKMALSLRVVDADTGKTISLGQGLRRYLGYVVATLPLGVGLLWVGFDKRKQGWHDKMARTVVVRAKNNSSTPVSSPAAGPF